MTRASLNDLYNHLKNLGWPLNVLKGKLIISLPGKTPIEIASPLPGNKIKLTFVWYSQRDSKYDQRVRWKLVFPDSVKSTDLLYLSNRGYKLMFEREMKAALRLDSYGHNEDKIEVLELIQRKGAIRHNKDQHHLQIPLLNFQNISTDAEVAYKTTKRYRDAIERHLTNEISRKHLKYSIGRLTTYKEGEFKFLIDRFHLKTKEKKADFHKFLSSQDIAALESIFYPLLKHEIFTPDYLSMLDDFIIKKRLREIISIGKIILSLPSNDLKTKNGKKIISLLRSGKIKQLESVWQKFFEKYLLFLIFSYKQIFPKVKLRLDGDKKYPDFIGINHYYGVDALEIKTHLTPALSWDKSHKNYSFSPDLSKAIIQTTNYLSAISQVRFRNIKDREKITESTYEENLYSPRGIIIISSDRKLAKPIAPDKNQELIKRDFTQLRRSLKNIEILTFSEIIEMADAYQENIVGGYQSIS